MLCCVVLCIQPFACPCCMVNECGNILSNSVIYEVLPVSESQHLESLALVKEDVGEERRGEERSGEERRGERRREGRRAVETKRQPYLTFVPRVFLLNTLLLE